MAQAHSGDGDAAIPAGAARLAERIAAALEQTRFDPQHGGELFLRADAEKGIRAAFGDAVRIAAAGRDDPEVRPAGFLGARFRPDLVVQSAGGEQVAVTITLLRADAGPVASALAGALVLAGRYQAVVAFILDRRLERRGPFDEPATDVGPRALSEAEQALIDRLWRQGIRVAVRRQDPFGWD
jgi:hypothetical protein